MPIKIYIITVVGCGSQFPLDMLRYDNCWPATQEDVELIHESVSTRVHEHDVKITLHSHIRPTVSRWNSFGWVVDRVD